MPKIDPEEVIKLAKEIEYSTRFVEDFRNNKLEPSEINTTPGGESGLNQRDQHKEIKYNKIILGNEGAPWIEPFLEVWNEGIANRIKDNRRICGELIKIHENLLYFSRQAMDDDEFSALEIRYEGDESSALSNGKGTDNFTDWENNEWQK